MNQFSHFRLSNLLPFYWIFVWILKSLFEFYMRQKLCPIPVDVKNSGRKLYIKIFSQMARKTAFIMGENKKLLAVVISKIKKNKLQKTLGVHQGILLVGWAWVGQLHWTMIGAHKNPADIQSNYRLNGHTNRVIFQFTNNGAQHKKNHSLARGFFFFYFPILLW